MRDEIDRRAMATLSVGHLAVDFASGAVPALLPFLALEFDLSYTATAAMMLAALVSSSLVQPAFGLWSDRRGATWLLPGGVALAAVGVGAAAVAPAYVLVLVAVFAAGIGVAAYHPEGAKFAAFASGRQRASGMSYFNIGGNTGYALGPIVVTPLVVWLGLGGGTLAMLPVLGLAFVILRALPALQRVVPEATERGLDEGEDDVRAMTLLSVVIGLRSVAWFGLLTFVPLWVVANGGTAGEGGRTLSLMLVSGAVGTIVLGPVADRVGLRRTLLVTQAALPFLVVTFVAVGGIAGVVALMLVGPCVVGTFGVTMVLSQLYLPIGR
jgi:MFS transporter, FSR family, fosmidomycin resistance protein